MSLARILGKTAGRPSYMSDSRWVLPTTFIGVENEYEGVLDRDLPKHTYADFWTYHEEGSLKDHGAEYAFSNPLFGVDAYNSIEWLISHAKNSRWKCSKRTGIHVHMDVRDLTVPQFGGMSMIYGAAEPLLYRWVGDGRASSHFCIPLYRADEALLGACSILKAALADDKEEGSKMALGHAESFQRYAGYNLQALHKFGSVEYRHLQTTHDLDRVITWINMLMSLKAAAYKLPQSDGAVVRMLEKLSVREFLNYVFPREIADQLYTQHSEEEYRCVGLPTARDIAVHGCGETSWVNSDFPKGENGGFIKWIKNTKVKGSKSEYNEYELEENNAPREVEDEDFEPLDEVEAQNPAPPPPQAQARFVINEAVANWANDLAEVQVGGIVGQAVPAPVARDPEQFARDRMELERILNRGRQAAAERAVPPRRNPLPVRPNRHR